MNRNCPNCGRFVGASGHICAPAATPGNAALRSRIAAEAAADCQPGRSAALERLLATPEVAVIIEAFARHGQQVFPVGGCIRSALLGEKPKDIDLCTATRPDDIETVLSTLPGGSVHGVGKAFGTIAVSVSGPNGAEEFEVTTFRGEHYPDETSRRPEVQFADTLEADLSRRDFTINAMAVSPNGELVDLHGGLGDIEARGLRCVGNPESRFAEDPLRIVRAARFAATLPDGPWHIDPATAEAAPAHAHRIASAQGEAGAVSRERVTAEMRRVLDAPDPQALGRFVDACDQLGVTEQVFNQLDVRGAVRDANVSPSSRLGLIYVYNGGPAGTNMVEDRLAAMTFSNDERKRARQQGDCYDLITSNESAAAVRRHDDATIDAAIEIATALGQERRIATGLPHARRSEKALRAPLPIDGHAIMEAGYEGRQVGEVRRRLEATYVTHLGDIGAADLSDMMHGEGFRRDVLRSVGEPAADN